MTNLDNVNKRKIMEMNEDDLLILKENEEISTNKKLQYLSYTERYFKMFYKLNVRYANNDHLILMHSNKVAVCSIAPSHPLLDQSKYKVIKIEFIQNVTDEMSGKHKHFAKNVHVDQPICKIYCNKIIDENTAEEVYFLICACLNAKLIEINENLITNPSLIQTHPSTQGYIAILMAKLANLSEQTSELINHSDYLTQINDRNKI